MTHEEIRSMCEVAKNLALDVNDEELRPLAFGAILSALLNGSSSGHHETASSTVVRQAPRSRQGKAPRKAGLKARLNDLVDANFFQSAKSVAEITGELRTQGWLHQPKEISARLIDLAREKRLRRSDSTSGFQYSNW